MDLTRHRVSSTYAEIFFDDDFCDYRKPLKLDKDKTKLTVNDDEDQDDWVSPSDLLIGIIELKPPFTSKITRGKTHEGILAIGNGVLENERTKFLKHLKELLNDNENGWKHILQSEKKLVQREVRKIYNDIFNSKSKIMSKEISQFYEKSLQELEDHFRSELKSVVTSVHANTISNLNIQIKDKLAKEKTIVEEILQKRYNSEIKKVNEYYKILYANELQRNKKLINQALYERNNALSAFYKQIEAENLTSSMYVMCTERKKCKVKQFILDNYQTTDIAEKMQKIKERQHILDENYKKEVSFSQINIDWEEKIKKVLQLFLKFISFSLKLLPEQSTFLLDLERMLVLQMNEIQKQPEKCPSILVEENQFQNLIKFEKPASNITTCPNEPFFIIGDLNDPTPPRYGSRETLPSDVDLPIIRLDRQFIYAKCHNFEQIKKLFESEHCKCQDIPSRSPSNICDLSGTPTTNPTMPPSPLLTESISSDEPLLTNDIKRLRHCPARKCQNWTARNSFPYLNSYLDYTEDNFERVKTVLGKSKIKVHRPDMLDPKKYVTAELPFSATREPHHTVETQYSSQEELYSPEVGCTCLDSVHVKRSESNNIKESPSQDLNTILQKRKISLRNIIQKNIHLLKMFTDECYDFQL